MTRIVGGVAGGRPLSVPPNGTRPTADRVRAALFSTLETMIELCGARVLDLFAGTGAVGLEAASRGAASVSLVDSGREAVLAMRRNVDTLGLAGVTVHPQRVESYLGELGKTDAAGGWAGTGEAFDLVFADPPYEFADPSLAELLATLAGAGGWLAPGAVVVVERSKRSGPAPWPVAIEAIKDKRYGDTVLWYGRRD